MKRVIFVILAMLFALNVFGAGSSQQSTSPVTGPLTIEWLVFPPSRVLANPENEAKKLLEEKYNVKINIIGVIIQDSNAWNLYWSAGNRPHYSSTNQPSTDTFRLVEQGIVREIPEGWLDLYMPDWMSNIYISIPKDTVYKQISTNGKTYIVPYTGGIQPYTLALRHDWLDKLGIKQLPRNNSEFYDILRRFTFDDPDGNGKKDTYGIHASMQNQYFSYVTTSQGLWNKTFREENGRIVFNDVKDEWRDHLKMLHDWYAAGIVDPESFIDDRTVQRQKWASNMIGAIGDASWWFATSTPGNLLDSIKEKVPSANIVQLAPFPDSRGRQLMPTLFLNSGGGGASFFTTKANDTIMKKVMEIRNDMAKDVNFYLRMYYGIEGRDYDFVDKLLTPKADQAKPEYVADKGLRQTFSVTPMPYKITRNAGLNSKAEIELYDYMFQFDVFYMSNNFVFSGSNASHSLYAADIFTLCDEYYVNAITGKINIDASWDAFKRSLNNAGLQAVINDFQAGLSK